MFESQYWFAGATIVFEFMLSFVVTTNVSCFLFLFARMHNYAVAGSNSIIKLSKKTQIALFMVHIGFNIINTVGFTIFGRDADRSAELAKGCELKWLGDRGGRLMIYGPFGDPQYFKSEVYLLGVTLLFTTPIPVVLTIDSVRKLMEYRKCVVAMFHMFFPLTMLYTAIMIDYHESVSEGDMTTMRVVPLMALITDLLHSSLIFILKTRGHNKILALFSQRCQRIRPKSKSCVLSTQVTRIE
ncbi:hypothetical protein PRIPAC_81903 [Pristionchus pacificus]|uniref:Uncharacterized protein n=1 Tax=Pristionchus pacificus TaxID=54126 RepID=A0A2A6C497_PRIPA|nr:hypothetical protein PRIPAC_81903 [Pristionchus pacificus]|eukprot:PDM72873.1 hypothetical protein PRIPAC_39307 [Pristionchus pacificus]